MKNSILDNIIFIMLELVVAWSTLLLMFESITQSIKYMHIVVDFLEWRWGVHGGRLVKAPSALNDVILWSVFTLFTSSLYNYATNIIMSR